MDFARLWKTLKKMEDKELAHYASSLSFHTILSLIPILLISFSIFTKMPSFKEQYGKIQAFIFNSMIPTQQDTITQYLNKFMENTGSMGTVGLIFVLYVSIMFFFDYEKIVSSIFKVKTRTLWESLTTYWTMITLMPLGLAISFYFSKVAQDFLSKSSYTDSINIYAIFPYFIIWFLFFIMYIISSNVKVNKKMVIIASFVASLVWYISKSLFVFYVTYNQTYLSIYGSFSIVMFFFLWIYFSWLIYLYGMKLYCVLNEEYAQGKEEYHESKTPIENPQDGE
ncbi:YihY family inner membrane protein [Sulfurospirillum sp. 1612]|uniref:YihY family inner membrane protein n=1 Tax=Sulfurospirillum sp. 1612 TaxID=3094835 RepID=UPI002F94E96D